MLGKILKGFALVWFVLAGILVLVGLAGVWMSQGFSAVRDTMSPFNLVNWLAIALLLSPGLGALIWAEKIERKRVVSQLGRKSS
jgi:hypothetical protein